MSTTIETTAIGPSARGDSPAGAKKRAPARQRADELALPALALSYACGRDASTPADARGELLGEVPVRFLRIGAAGDNCRRVRCGNLAAQAVERHLSSSGS